MTTGLEVERLLNDRAGAHVTATRPRVSVVIPAFQEERGIGEVVRAVRQVLGPDAEILVVDDGSIDGTARIAEAAGAQVLSHPYNIGNGAAVKTGLRAARGAAVVLMDGDGQHAPEDIPRFLALLDRYDMVVGARTVGSRGRFHRTLANRAYNGLASYVCARSIPDLTSGFRAARADVIRRFIYLLPNTFSYPTTLTLGMFRAGHRVAFEPIAVRPRVGKSKIRLLEDGSRFVLIILKIATLYAPFRVFLPVSLLFLVAGAANYAYTYATAGRFTNMSGLMLANSVLVFLLSLIAEQIAQLRLDRTESDATWERRREP